MRYVAMLVVLLVAVGWSAAEINLENHRYRQPSAPQWRRTSEGWVKVGDRGAAALDRPNGPPATPPALHPRLVTAFILLAALLSLAIFDKSEGHRHPGIALRRPLGFSRKLPPVW